MSDLKFLVLISWQIFAPPVHRTEHPFLIPPLQEVPLKYQYTTFIHIFMIASSSAVNSHHITLNGSLPDTGYLLGTWSFVWQLLYTYLIQMDGRIMPSLSHIPSSAEQLNIGNA